MKNKMIWIGWFALCGVGMPIAVSAQTNNTHKISAADDIPDRELLEFLADFGDADEEAFELMIFHGMADIKQADDAINPEVKRHEQ